MGGGDLWGLVVPTAPCQSFCGWLKPTPGEPFCTCGFSPEEALAMSRSLVDHHVQVEARDSSGLPTTWCSGQRPLQREILPQVGRVAPWANWRVHQVPVPSEQGPRGFQGTGGTL
jgi:hypothetical protein